ncbi:hypothetical protein NE865_12298 [Phthorimaea operculella]|nr:hypothetical protein NE865_12298 [Phthorimaea operculella]
MVRARPALRVMCAEPGEHVHRHAPQCPPRFIRAWDRHVETPCTPKRFREAVFKAVFNQRTEEDALGIYDEICLDDTDVALELSTIIVAVFQNKISAIEYLSHSVCKECAKSAINAFRFIERCTAMNNTMINTIANLDEITEKKVVTGRGMYIMADPENFEGKVFCDTRKTLVTLVVKRFQKFVQSESAPKKSKKVNVECEACGVVLQRKSLYGHRKRCKGQMNKLQSNIELDNIENKEINDIEEKIEINEDEKEEKNEVTDGAMDHNSVDSDEGNVLGDENDSWHAEKERKKAERRSYLENLEKVTCQYCHIPLKHKYKIQNHSLFSCEKIPKNEKELLKKKCEDRKIQREALQKQLEMIKANGGDVKSYKLSLKRKICEFCGASLSTKFTLKKHLLTLCKGLDESNRTEEYVTALLKINPHKPRKRRLCNTSTKIGKATCSYCDQSFQDKTILSKHIHKECKNTPTELKYAVCSQCGKQCSRISLALHEKSHTLKFPCGKCGKVFKDKRSYRNHLRMPDCVNEPYVVPEPEKKYGCHACEGVALYVSAGYDTTVFFLEDDNHTHATASCDCRLARAAARCARAEMKEGAAVAAVGGSCGVCG